MRVALATAARLPDLAPDDRLLLAELRARGVSAEPAVWEEKRDWAEFDAVIVRSCWDSHLKRDAFLEWAHMVGAAGVRLFNPAELLVWNTDKRYLRELQARDVAVVPTVWVEPSNDPAGRPRLADVLERNGLREVVVKPAISAGAHETWRATPATAAGDEARFASLLDGRTGAVMIQPFMDEVLTEGEWALIFVDGNLSHTVIKRPRSGDFRVQPDHGGSTSLVQAPASAVRDALHVVHTAAAAAGVPFAEILYARVDGVMRDGRLVLMELECVEPNLFFECAPGSASRAAGVIVERLSHG